MQSPSSTFISKILFVSGFLLLASFPTLLVTTYVLPIYSGLKQNGVEALAALSQVEQNSVAILGESTLKSLETLPPELKNNDDIVVLSLPGSTGGDMLELLRLALERKHSIELVIYGTVMPGAVATPSSTRGNLPTLYSFERIFQSWREGKFSADVTVDLVFRKFLPILNAKADIYSRILNYISHDTRRLVQMMDAILPNDSAMSSSPTTNPLLEMSRFTASKGIPLIFFLGPHESKKRAHWSFIKVKKGFEELCKLPLECWDLSESLPDDNFESDGFHMKGPQLIRFHSLLKEKIAEFKIKKNNENIEK